MPVTKLPLAPDEFARRLLGWFDVHGRHDLPWQKHITPYRVWVSEIMLQQTQVTTVIPYFERFITRFPNVAALATAKSDDVLALWTGLGYYARARNLHHAAQQVMTDFAGALPTNLDDLCSLSGIGRSTAGAILSIACQQRAPILDGNVKRVLTRLAGIDTPPSSAREQELWQLAEELTPHQHNADYTQAIMDLGATLCTRGKPDCARCPFEDVCQARRLGIAAQLPVGKPSKKLPVRSTFMVLLVNAQHEVLLTQRPPAGLWGGLWCPPELASLTELDSFLTNLGLVTDKGETLPTFRHTFSHFHLDITPVQLRVTKQQSIADSASRWVAPANMEALGLAAPVKKLLHNIASLH